jgi:hypothetical protein
MQLRKLVGGQSGRSSCRDVDIQECGKPTMCVGGQPPANGAATDAKQGRDGGTGAGLAARQYIQRMEALLLVELTLTTQEVLQLLSGFVDWWNDLIHVAEHTILMDYLKGKMV